MIGVYKTVLPDWVAEEMGKLLYAMQIFLE